MFLAKLMPIGRHACLKGFALLSLSAALAAMAQTHTGRTTFEVLAADALSARESGRIPDAIRNYQAAVSLHPDWDEGWWYLGTLQYDAEHFAEAIPALRRVVELHPQMGTGFGFLGLCEFETGDYGGAFDHLQSAVQFGFAESPELEKVVVYHLGLLLNSRSEFDSVTDLLSKAFGPGPFPEQIKTALGISFLRVPLLPQQVDPAKDALIHAAGETAALLAAHDDELALRNLEQMLRDYPNTPYLHYRYGVALAAVSRDDRAEAELREEIRITPRSPLPWIALAKLQQKRQDIKHALETVRSATDLAPQSAEAHQTLASILQAVGRGEEASSASAQALQLAHRSPEVDSSQVKQYSLNRYSGPTGSSRGESASHEPGAAATDFDTTVHQAEAARNEGQLDQAISLYQKGLKLRPSWQEGWRQLGTLEYMQSRYPEAIAALQQSVSVNANQPDTWTLLGLCEFETTDYKNSLLHLERGRALGFSGNAAAVRISRYHLALLFNLNGNFDGAIGLLTPEIGSGALSEEIRFAMGMALLRIPALPDQIKADQHSLVMSAGEAAELLSGSYYDRAFHILESLLTENPTTLFLHYAYGDALASASRYDEAQVQLGHETRLNPSSELAYVRLASLLLVLHRPQEAIEDAKKATALAPESPEARYQLGRAFLEGGDPASAVRELEVARRLLPNSPKVHFSLARAYAQVNRSSEAQSERAEFERLKNQLPALPNSYGDRSARGVSGEATAQTIDK